MVNSVVLIAVAAASHKEEAVHLHWMVKIGCIEKAVPEPESGGIYVKRYFQMLVYCRVPPHGIQ